MTHIVIPGTSMVQDHVAPSQVRRRVQERHAFLELIRMANRLVSPLDIAQQLAVIARCLSECQAVAVRIKTGLGFPYAASLGFPHPLGGPDDDLYARDERGQLVRDEHHEPVLACVCGQVALGRVQPDHPLLTPRGSLVMSSRVESLGVSRTADMPGHLLNLHHVSGYETVGLFPVCLGQEHYGLIQCNDPRPERLTPESVELLEGLAASAADLLEVALP